MVAYFKRRVVAPRELDCINQLTLELTDAVERCDPPTNVRRLHDDALDLFSALEHPLDAGGPHRGGSVEHKLFVFFCRDGHAAAELPVQHDGAVAQTPEQVGRAEHAGKKVAKANAGFNGKPQLHVGVYVVQCGQRREQLLVQQLLRQHLARVLPP